MPELPETASLTVSPTIGATSGGRLVGRLASIRVGLGGAFTLGNLLAVASLPITLAAFAWQLLPPGVRRYRLTSRRVVVLKGLRLRESAAIGLDEFDAVRIEVLPGQEYLHSGEVVFLRKEAEVLRLSGVRRPEVFRRTCLTAQTALRSVRNVVQQQAAVTSPG
jgi:hypothetical protein